MSITNSNSEKNFDLLSYYKNHLSKFNKLSDLSESDQVKVLISYVQNLYDNSEIDPSDKNFLELVEKCKKAIESDCKTIFSNLYFLAKLLKKHSKPKSEQKNSTNLSSVQNEEKGQETDKEERELAFLADAVQDEILTKNANLDSGIESESKTKKSPQSEKKILTFTSVKSRRITQFEQTNLKTSTDVQNSVNKIGSVEFSSELTSNDKDSLTAEKASIADIENNESASVHEPESNDELELKNLTSKELRILKNIKKLDDFCLSLNEKIKESENREITSEDLNDEKSIFIYEANLKKKFVEAYSKLTIYCKKFPHLIANDYKINKSRSPQFSKKINFDGTHYDEINTHLSECLNRSRQFPDFVEVLEWIKEANNAHNLKIEEKKLFEISQLSFEKICKILKSRRIADDLRVQKSRIENLLKDEEDKNHVLTKSDPAKNDKDLETILENNRKAFDEKYIELIDSYAKKQEDNQNMEGEEAEVEEETDEDDDDEEETKSNLESNDTVNLSLLSEDLKADSSHSSTSDSENQIYCTPPEIKSSEKSSNDDFSHKPAKRIKLEDNLSSGEESCSNNKLDSNTTSKKNLPKIVECSSAFTEVEECIVLD